ncbi:MAG: flagellar basal-body MS-ring/collar protein FliF [Rhodobacter sp.]|nr:flagellar basal-body MS-ring/collar protein FliF [Rhodobacter sp.]
MLRPGLSEWETTLQQILSVWSTLDLRRRAIVVGATLAMFAAVLGVSRMATQPSMALLYSGLEPGAAGDVVAALDQQGVTYDIRQGAIYVDAAQRDALRMTLAAEGLPANGGQGYELLDSLTGFGTTSQMFDAAYWRAKEGELARTISASPHIKSARVHISNPSSNPFQRGLKPTASVTVTTSAGALSVPQAKALKFLVASAVAGLAPGDVSIIDGRGGLVMPVDEPPGMAGGEDREADLRRNIQRILEARVGPGRAVVEVTVETVTEREAIVERRFDPENRVAISSETEERSTSSSGSQGGEVTVASNLPDGDAAGGENRSRSENSESRERVNYEVSETTREILRTPGAIKRLSVAVLVDGLRSVDPVTNTETWAPRSDEEMAALRELVASAVGFDADRGDTITLKSMEFKPVEPPGLAEAPPWYAGVAVNPMTLIQLGVLAFVALALGLFVVRPILARRPDPVAGALAPPDQSALRGLPGAAEAADRAALPAATGPALTGEIDDGTAPLPQMALVSGDDPAVAAGPSGADARDEDPVERLRRLIDDRREETVEILRSWMEDHEERA